MFVARLTEESTLRLEGEEVVPLTYRYQRKGLGRSRETTQQFDWANGEVRGVHKKEEFTLPTQPGLLDKTTYQLALQRDLMAGKTEMSYLVLDGDEIEQYQFRVTGEDRVTTRNGQFDAVEVQRVREPDARRETTLWFAKDWNYLLVRLSQVETDGQHYQIVLKEATMDGQPVVGAPVRQDWYPTIPSLPAKPGTPERAGPVEPMDCHVAGAPRNDVEVEPRHPTPYTSTVVASRRR